jgi:hypothetical protein
LVQRLCTADELRKRLDRLESRGRPGVRQLREIVEARQREFAGDSALEAKLFALMRKAGLPRGVPCFDITDERAHHVAQVDLAYPADALAIQVEGYRWHGGRRRFAEDLRARNRLLDLGWRVIHVTWEDLRDRPAELIARLETYLRPRLPGF